MPWKDRDWRLPIKCLNQIDYAADDKIGRRCWAKARKDGMQKQRKITVKVPPDLLHKARQITGLRIVETVRTGLNLVAASRVYCLLRKLRGKIRFGKTVGRLKAGR